jgi:ABC-2 type transport system permease protein
MSDITMTAVGLPTPDARFPAVDRVWTVARRELKGLFDHPTGYILLVVFVAANDFLFFRQAFLMGVASLRPMLELLPWLFMFFVPAVSMRVIAEETRSGVIEVVLTQPINEIEFLAGKYLGAVLFLLIGLGLTIPIPFGLWLGSDLHWGPIVAQYAGAAMLVMGLAGVGVWASTVARSQITAFILAVAITFLLVLVGLDPLIVGLGPTAGAIAARLGVLSHFESIGRGVIDLRDVIYFLSLAGVFLGIAYGSLVRRRLAPGGETAKRLRLGVVIIAVGFLVVDLAGGYIGGR